MIHRWKGFDMEITHFVYQFDPTPSGGNIPSQISNPQTYRDIECFRKTYI